MKSYWYFSYITCDGYNSATLRLDGLFFSVIKAKQELKSLIGNKDVCILYHSRISKKDYLSSLKANNN